MKGFATGILVLVIVLGIQQALKPITHAGVPMPTATLRTLVALPTLTPTPQSTGSSDRYISGVYDGCYLASIITLDANEIAQEKAAIDELCTAETGMLKLVAPTHAADSTQVAYDAGVYDGCYLRISSALTDAERKEKANQIDDACNLAVKGMAQ
jgi:hypothetical protein